MTDHSTPQPPDAGTADTEKSRPVRVHLTPAALAVIGRSDSLSGRINDIATRYGQIVVHDLPALSPSQWCAVIDALNGTYLDAFSVGGIFADIADYRGLGDKWNIDQPALVARLADLSFGQKVAVAETAARYWQATGAGASHADAWQAAGLPPDPDEPAAG